MSTLSKFLKSLGNKSSQPPKAGSSRPEYDTSREMGFMVQDQLQAVSYISLEEAQKSRAIALRSLKLLQPEMAKTLCFATSHSDLSWPSVRGLVSLEEARKNRTIACRAVHLL